MSGRPIGVLRRIAFDMTIAIFLLIVVMTLLILFIYLPDYENEMRFLVSLITCAALIYAGYYAATTLKSKINIDRKHRSFEIMEKYNNIDMAILRIFIEKVIDSKKLSQQEIYDKIFNNHELLYKTTILLGFLEDLSIAIQENIVDENILFKSLSFISEWAFNNLNLYIKELRSKNNDSSLYIEFEKLSDAWKNKKSLYTGEIFNI